MEFHGPELAQTLHLGSKTLSWARSGLSGCFVVFFGLPRPLLRAYEQDPDKEAKAKPSMETQTWATSGGFQSIDSLSS